MTSPAKPTDPNNPDPIGENPTKGQVSAAANGMVIALRDDIQDFALDIGILGREALRIDGSDPRWISELLIGSLDPGGDPFLFPLAYQDVNLPDLVRDYGTAFVKTLESARVGDWAGPVISPYGWHLVKVTARRPGAAAPFDAVRDQVRDAWLAERRESGRATFMKDLHRRYRVVVAGVDK